MAAKRKDAKELQARGRKLLTYLNNKELEPIRDLLRDGVDFSVMDKGDAAIHLAARCGLTDVIDQLWRHGDSVTRPNQNSNTPLHYAARNGHMTTVKYLREKGATMNDKNEDGDTPLHFAVMYQPMDFVEKLVEYGMKVNAQNAKGETPLHVAVVHNRTEAMEALLVCHANPDIVDKKGKKATDVAKTPMVAAQIQMVGDLMAAMTSGYIHAQGISVDPKQTSLELSRVGVNVGEIKASEKLPYQFYCRREKSENSVVKFSTAESEELISDVYHFRVTDAIDVVKFDARIPLYSNIDMNEQPALKYADGRVVEFEGIVVEEETVYCSVCISISPGGAEVFVVISKPRVEEHSIGTIDTTLQSSMEDDFQLQIPQGSFGEDTTVLLKIYDTIDCADPSMQKTKADRVRQLLTDIYAVDIMGEQPSNDIRVQFPLATDVEDDSDIVIVAADENNLVDETCLEVIPSKPERKGNTLSFDVSHFSIHVAVSMRMMTASPRSVFNQIISSRERKRPAVFFVMILEQGPCKNIAVVECVLADNVYSRQQYWSAQGYVCQDPTVSPAFLMQPGREFRIIFQGNVTSTRAEDKRKLTFVPKRPSFQPYRLSIQDLDKALVGEMSILSIDETEQATASKEGSGKELTKLTFKVPPPPKPVDLEKPGNAARFDVKESQIKNPILFKELYINLILCQLICDLLVAYLKNRFSKYPFIEENDPDLQVKIDELLEVISVYNAPNIMLRNIFLYVQSEFSNWRQAFFHKLVNNIEGTDTAAFSVNTLVKYMFQDFGLTTTIRPAQRRMIIIMRANAFQTHAFMKTAKRAGLSGYPVSPRKFWKEYKKLYDTCESYYGKRDGLRKLDERETARIEKYRKGQK